MPHGRIKNRREFLKRKKKRDNDYVRDIMDRDIENNPMFYRKKTGPVNKDDTPFIPPNPDKKSQDAFFRKIIRIDRGQRMKEPGWAYNETITHDLSEEYGWDWTPGQAGYRTDVFANLKIKGGLTMDKMTKLFEARKELEVMVKEAVGKSWRKKPKKDIQYKGEPITVLFDDLGRRFDRLAEEYKRRKEQIRGLNEKLKEIEQELDELLEVAGVEEMEAVEVTLERYKELLEEGKGKVGSLSKMVVVSGEKTENILRITNRVRATMSGAKYIMKKEEILNKLKEALDEENYKIVEEALEELDDVISISSYIQKEVRDVSKTLKNAIEKQLEEGLPEAEFEGKKMTLSVFKTAGWWSNLWEKVKNFFKSLYDALSNWLASLFSAEDSMEDAVEVLTQIENELKEVEAIL